MSIEAIGAALAEVRAELVRTHHSVRVAQQRLTEAVEALVELSRNHSASLLPEELRRADEQCSAALDQLAGVVAALDAFVAML